jgi:hypothetical protein
MKKYLSALALVLLMTAPAYCSVIGDLEMLDRWVLELKDEADALGAIVEDLAEDIAFLRGRGEFTYETEDLERRAYELHGDIFDLKYRLSLLSANIYGKLEICYGGGTVTTWEVDSLERLAAEYDDELYALEIQAEKLDEDVAWLEGRAGVWGGGCDSLGLGMGVFALAGLALMKKQCRQFLRRKRANTVRPYGFPDNRQWKNVGRGELCSPADPFSKATTFKLRNSEKKP